MTASSSSTHPNPILQTPRQSPSGPFPTLMHTPPKLALRLDRASLSDDFAASWAAFVRQERAAHILGKRGLGPRRDSQGWSAAYPQLSNASMSCEQRIELLLAELHM